MKLKEKKSVSYIAIGIVVVAICLALIIVFKPEPVTGSAVYVKYYGVSNQPLVQQRGKIQTYVKLPRESISNIEHDSGEEDTKVARDIVETADFGHWLAELYENNPAAPVRTVTELNAVMEEGAEALARDFRAHSECVKRAALLEIGAEEMEFVVVTELKYRDCNEGYKRYESGDWSGATATHIFYTIEGVTICTHESYPLFVIEKGTGELSSKVGEC